MNKEIEEEEQPTKQQLELFNELTEFGEYCPNCKSDGGQHMNIENPGEKEIQVYCVYGCGYYFLNNI